MLKTKYILAFLLLFLLVLIRFIEKKIFDDGLIDFFHHQYLTGDLPEISFWRIMLIDSLRYWLNSIISIGIMYLFFSQKYLFRFLFSLYLFVFLVALAIYYYQLRNYSAGNYLGLFYVRRLLIQPLLLFVLIPALLYQKSLDNN